jgi:integrase
MAFAAREWERLLREILDKEAPIYDRLAAPLFKEFGAAALRRVAINKGYKDSTRDIRERDYAAIESYFGDLRLDQITEEQIAEWQERILARGAGAARVKNLRSVLNLVFKAGKKWVKNNPLKDVELPKAKRSAKTPLNSREATALIAAAEGWFRNYLTFAILTGARPGEIIALEWRNVDFEQKTVKIEQTWSLGFLQTPKTAGSARKIRMSADVEAALRAQFSATGGRGFVFQSDSGNGYKHIGSLRRKWNAALDRAGVSRRKLYSTRHTFASLMLMRGAKVGYVSRMLGHKDAKTTLEFYAEYIPEEDAVSEAAMENILAATSKNTQKLHTSLFSEEGFVA